MKKKTEMSIAIMGVFLLFGIATLAFAGTEPSPFRFILQNNSHIIDPGEVMYNKTIQAGVIEFYYRDPDTPGVPPTLWGTLSYPAVGPGQQTPGPSEWTESAGQPPDPYDVFCKHEGLIDVYPMYSFTPGTTMVAEDPGEPPFATFHSPRSGLPIFGFASPGVLVGTMTVSSTAVSGGSSPAVGGVAEPINKMRLLLPWMTVATLILLTIGIVVFRRERK
ncbi:MAG: hypothetical protein ACYSUX_00300 [Planctomycetota bacterium]|jgi:hypothetical protein